MHVPLQCHFTRRTFVRLMAAAGLLPWVDSRPTRAQPQTVAPAYSYPMGFPGRPLGDGLLVRHGYATENTWYNPGWLHTGEDWYLPEGGDGRDGRLCRGRRRGRLRRVGVPRSGRHRAAPGWSLFDVRAPRLRARRRGGSVGRARSVAGHRSSPAPMVCAPSHLHFEIRTFFTTPEVNGNAPRYGVACGFDCPPGPGYWPIDAPEHPSVMGWRNPTHVINRRAWPDGVPEGSRGRSSPRPRRRPRRSGARLRIRRCRSAG